MTIDATTFRMPNRVDDISINKIYQRRRSANNTLITSVYNYNAKKEYVFDYDMLTDSEFTFLEGKNFSVVALVISDTGYSINGNYFLEITDYGWRQAQRKNLQVKFSEV